MKALARALAAAKAGDLGATRGALIEAWRARRSPVIAELVELVDRAAPPDAVTTALAAIVTPRAATSTANLAALIELDDPRLAGFAIRNLVDLPFTAATAAKFLGTLVAVAARHDDPRLVDAVVDIREAMRLRISRAAVRDGLLRAVEHAVEATPKLARPTPEVAALEAALTAALEPLRKTARSAETLLADIQANPTDDAARLVYADLLSDACDPRGELVALQLGRAPDAAPSPRETELLARHGKAWLGKLAPALSWGRGYSRTTFARGFLSTADIILSVGNKLQPIYHDPMWSTVECLRGTWDVTLLFQAPLRALRTVDRYLDHKAVAILAERTEPLAALEVLQLNVAIDDPAPISPAQLARAFPNLRQLLIYRELTTVADLRAFAAIGIRRLEIDHYQHTGTLTDAAAAAAWKALRAELKTTPPLFDTLSLRPPWKTTPAPDTLAIWPSARR